jgi:protein gp37
MIAVTSGKVARDKKMSDNTKIEWTDATWNIITGCSVVSAGCKNCYAMKLAGTRLKHHTSRAGLTIDTKNGPVWNGEVRFNQQWLGQPLRWSKPRMIFVCAHSDLFHESVPDDWIDTVFAVMALAKQHVFQVLTKRPERMRQYFDDLGYRAEQIGIEAEYISGLDRHLPDLSQRWTLPLSNVWIGVSVENQEAADKRIPILLDTPAAVRWISAEPLLGPLEILKWLDPYTCSDCGYHGAESDAGPDGCEECGEEFGGGDVCEHCGADEQSAKYSCPQCGSHYSFDRDYGFMFPGSAEHGLLNWVVVGGESGDGSRPMHPEWARSLHDQCVMGGVRFLFKQWGDWAPVHELKCNEPGIAGKLWHNFDPDTSVCRIGKKAAGRLLDGVAHDGYPESSK